MSKLLRLAATVDFSLVLVQVAFHPAALPLGGAHTVQIALCLGLAFISGELHELIGEYGWHSIKLSARKHADRRNTPPIVNFDLIDIQSNYSGAERRVIALTHGQAARVVGRQDSAVSCMICLINLTPPVQQLLMTDDLVIGHTQAQLVLEAGQQAASTNGPHGAALAGPCPGYSPEPRCARVVRNPQRADVVLTPGGPRLCRVDLSRSGRGPNLGAR